MVNRIEIESCSEESEGRFDQGVRTEGLRGKAGDDITGQGFLYSLWC